MATLTTRADIARAMYIGTKEVFMKNLEKQPSEQWKAYATVKNSDMMEETYDSVGNLKPAHIKAEGDPVVYGDIKQAYVTTIKNETIANGFSVTMEAQEDEKWGIVPETKVNELMRTMISKREQEVAAVWDNVTTRVGADGVPYASSGHPNLNSPTTKNDNLINAVFDIESYQDGVKRFNHWNNHYGDKFYTNPSAMLAHRDRQTNIFAMLQSVLLPFEASITNTKNTIPQLKTIFSNYIDSLQVHILDETIDSAVFQKRKGLTDGYYYDEESTFNFYYNVHERYKAGMINPGFGFVTISGILVALVELGGEIGVAGDKTITGLTSGTKYNLIVNGVVYQVLANGTVGTKGGASVALESGVTAITGLTNGEFYEVVVA